MDCEVLARCVRGNKRNLRSGAEENHEQAQVIWYLGQDLKLEPSDRSLKFCPYTNLLGVSISFETIVRNRNNLKHLNLKYYEL